MAEGAGALAVGDAAGEATSLEAAELAALVGIAAHVAEKRIPVLAGIASNATLKAGELAQCVERSGAAALLCGAPYYNKPTQEGVFAHFQWIAESTALPIILHDAPARTACPIADCTIKRLAEHPKFIGLIDATGDMARVSRLRMFVNSDFRLFAGDDNNALPFLSQGGHGWASLVANIVPGLCRNLYVDCRHGQVLRAQRLSLALAPLAEFLSRDGNPAALKAALAELGLVGPHLRSPLVPIADRSEIVKILKDLAVSYKQFLMVTRAQAVTTLSVARLLSPAFQAT
jgi:4-hydroxy-tetrahydrodipicolinate synthase